MRRELIAILACIILVGVMGFILLREQPLKITEPTDKEVLFDLTPTIKWHGKADLLEIDDNPSFSTPVRINVSEGNEVEIQTELTVSEYFIRLTGKKESVNSSFRIQGRATIEVEKTDLGSLLKNKGNVDLDVFVETTKGLAGMTGAIIVPAGKNRLLPNIFPKKVEAKEHER